MALTGSLNFTKVAQDRDAKNHLIRKDPALTPQDITNEEAHRAHSQPYAGRGDGESRGSHWWIGG